MVKDPSDKNGELTVSEQKRAADAFGEAFTLSRDALESKTASTIFTEREGLLLQELREIAENVVSQFGQSTADSEAQYGLLFQRKEVVSNDKKEKRIPIKTTFDLRWEAFKEAYNNLSPVEQFHGTDRKVGIGESSGNHPICIISLVSLILDCS